MKTFRALKYEKFLLETVNLKKTFKHLNGDIALFNDINLKIKEIL